MSNTDKKTERAIVARLAKVGRAFVKAGIRNATEEQKKDVLIRLLMNRQMALVTKNMSDWPRSSTIAKLLA